MSKPIVRTACLVALCLMMVSALRAQMKIGHLNSEAVMKELPDAQDAQKQLDAFVAEWQTMLNRMQDEWKKKFDEYDKRKLIMTEQKKAESEKELRELDQRMSEYRNQKFGQNGELFTKQSELMKPIQDRVFQAIQEVAIEEGYDYIFDKSGEILLMYATEKHDVTSKVLAKLQGGTPAQQPR